MGTTIDQSLDCDCINRTGRTVTMTNPGPTLDGMSPSPGLLVLHSRVTYINAMKVTHAREVYNLSPPVSLFPVPPSPSSVLGLPSPDWASIRTHHTRNGVAQETVYSF